MVIGVPAKTVIESRDDWQILAGPGLVSVSRLRSARAASPGSRACCRACAGRSGGSWSKMDMTLAAVHGLGIPRDS